MMRPLDNAAQIEGNFMKHMLEYTVRTTGLSFDQNFAGSGALLSAFSKWKPEDEKGLTIHAFDADRLVRNRQTAPGSNWFAV